MEFIWALAGIALGFVMAYMMQQLKVSQIQQKMLEDSNNNAATAAANKKELDLSKQELVALKTELKELKTKNETDREKIRENYDFKLKELEAKFKLEKEDDTKELNQKHESEIKRIEASHLAQITSLKDSFTQSMVAMKEEQNSNIQKLEDQWKSKTETLRVEFENLTNKHLAEQRSGMNTANEESLKVLLDPLKAKIADFEKAFSDNKDVQISFKASFEEQLKNMANQTNTLTEEAKLLSTALKANPKKQGNWGEQVLKDVLDASGMTEGIDYWTQARENGGQDIPDVKIKLPGKHPDDASSFIIVDSKTSLTDYLSYVSAEDEAEKAKSLKEHIASVKAHVDELSAKNYGQKVRNVAGYVMMFIPNEGAYLLAVDHDPGLLTYAYQKKIIILNTSNLMCALNLVHTLWRSQKQSENVEQIIETANKIYEKFAGFSQDFVAVGDKLNQANNSYEEAKKKLVSGKGNVIKQLENWKELGITTTKQISGALKIEAEDDRE